MDQQPIVTPFYLDKALWVALLTPILLFVASKLGLDSNTMLEFATGIILPAVTFIIMHKWKTTKLQGEAIRTNAAQEAGKTAAADPASTLKK